MSTTHVDPYLAGRADLATARANAAAVKVTAKATALAATLAAKEAAKTSAAERRESDRQTRLAEKTRRRAERWAALAALGEFLMRHWQLTLWLPVIVAPGILAWEGQTSAGNAIFGSGLGFLLALFTECSSWALLAQAEIRRRAGHPVGATLAAAWLVAAVGAGLNYVHGSQDPGASWHGVVMALVSVSGFAVHQVSHARLDLLAAVRAWWAGRGRRRLARAARVRVRRYELAAVRSATAVLHPDGAVSLRYPAGAVMLARRWWAPWTRRLVTGPAYSLAEDVTRLLADRPSGPSAAWPDATETPPARQSDTVSADVPGTASDESAAEASGRVQDPINRPGRDRPAPDAAGLSEADQVMVEVARKAIADGSLPAQPSGYAIYRHVLDGKGDKARAYRIQEALIGGDTRLHAVS
ncbi:hypothetical protein [Kutzneria sp. NPDC051319]|uniref:hypothetical protein n=1 Tax=Kutzneria sp. NPDC051319 TaxID=3155047 RepID=UPI0034231DEC